MDRHYENRRIFLEKIIEEYTNVISGENQDTVIGESPEETIEVGKLTGKNVFDNDLSSERNISSVGLEFFIDTNEIKNGDMEINIGGDLYYRAFPTLSEQREFILEKYNIENNQKFSTIDGLLYSDEVISEEILVKYKKIKLRNLKIKLNYSDIYDGDGLKTRKLVFNSDDPTNSLYEVEKIKNKLFESDEYYHPIKRRIGLEDIRSQGNWENFISKGKKATKYPNWSLSLIVESKIFKDGSLRVSIKLVNNTENEIKSSNSIRISTLFNSSIDVRLKGIKPQKRIMPYFQDSYKYDRNSYVLGINCSATYDNDLNELSICHLPIYYQYRLKTRSDYDTSFDSLITAPIETLSDIEQGMYKELEKWKDYFNEKSILDDISLEGKKQLKKEIEDFEIEIERFSNGIRVIQEYSLIYDAFINLNKTFKSASKYKSWRLFQLVFIVSNIPDVCTSEYTEESMGNINKIDKLDVLYFPTGGGKTEAFLGITVFTLFFDRFRGKNAGVSAFIKYPLRLLSVQQVQRVADILAHAEKIRKSVKDIADMNSFSLGYFVGGNNTPNDLDKFIEESEFIDLNKRYKILEYCPFCKGKNIKIEFDKKILRLGHKCLNEQCDWYNNFLPLHIVDTELYRYLPSVIISTIDKLASVGLQRNFRNLLGNVSGECPKHGYTSKKNCTERTCEEEIIRVDNLHDPAPTLFIQDELHLLRESLGAYNSHYEPFIHYFIENLTEQPKKVKIIGATATISAYEDQSKHLYVKDPIRFPAESPFIDGDFYSYIDTSDRQRTILGFSPYGKPTASSVGYTLKVLKRILNKYYLNVSLISNIEGIKLTSEKEAYDILKDYWILLQYNNVKLDGSRVLNIVEELINPELLKESELEFKIEKMTGDETFQDVRNVLAKVEDSSDPFNSVNLISATNMISHGVDAERFNIIVFQGIPSNTAEYVQAYSRVGRTFPGLSILIFKTTRERDLSYQKHFIKFHEYKDILVEPVPINRWANKAIERTFPGIISALLLNYYDYKIQKKGINIYRLNNLKKIIKEGVINIEEFKTHLKNIYHCNNNSIGKLYEKWIDDNTDKLFKSIRNGDFSDANGRNYFLAFGLEKMGFHKPMSSLRDTDLQILVEMRR